jgi:hypothetical protein
MTREEFAVIQRDGMSNALTGLIRDCLRRFLKAARLVSLKGPVVEGLENASRSGSIDLTPLLPAWHLICKRYREERFDAQAKLFQDQSTEALEGWGQFIQWELFPSLLREDEFVRNVLRVSLLLPCDSTAEAASAILHHVREMNLPYGEPAWDSTEAD